MNNNEQLNQSQKLMIFILTMSLYGMSTLFTELIPKVQLGIIELSIEYFLFIPITLAILFDPIYVALGAATGELVFSEIMLGQFGGLGEAEKFITLTIGIYVAGRIVKNPKNTKLIGIAAMLGVIIQQALGTIVDILKVQFAVEEFEKVSGLPESVYFTEGFAFLNDVLFSGILFCLIPTLYFVPKLYGKVEPLLGLKTRDQIKKFNDNKIFIPKIILPGILMFILAIVFEFLSESNLSLIDWEAAWAESNISIILSILLSFCIFLIIAITLYKKSSKKSEEAK
jgi:hypothetical protein